MALSAEQILAKKPQTREVHVPEFATDGDDVVIVRGMSAREQDAYQAAVAQFGSDGEVIGIDQNNLSAKLLVRCILNEDGTRAFPDDNQAEQLGDVLGSGVQKLMNAVIELSGMTEKAAKDLEGNSGAVPGDGASSGSPETATEEHPTN